jgi:hypothetical protein
MTYVRLVVEHPQKTKAVPATIKGKGTVAVDSFGMLTIPFTISVNQKDRLAFLIVAGEQPLKVTIKGFETLEVIKPYHAHRFEVDSDVVVELG